MISDEVEKFIVRRFEVADQFGVAEGCIPSGRKSV